MFKTGRPKGAERSWRKVLKLEPENILGYLNLAEVFIVSGDYTKSISTIKAALPLAPCLLSGLPRER